MKQLLLIFFMTASVLSLNANNGIGDDHKSYAIDVENSTINWVGKKVTGEHSGTLGIKNGKVVLHGTSLVGASLTMDMTKINVTDLEGGAKTKLEGHLRSGDFFNVEEYTESSFNTTKIEMNADGSGYIAHGKLTIKGISQEVSFPVTVSKGDHGELNIVGTASFDRTKFDIKYGSGKFFDSLGDKMIYDDIELSFNLVARAG